MSKRKSMRKIRELLRLHYEGGQGLRAIAVSLGGSPSNVHKYLGLASDAGLCNWEAVRELSEEAIEKRMFPNGRKQGRPEAIRSAIDGSYIHTELRGTAVTLQLLWEEYAEASKGRGERPYGYSQYCDHYAVYKKRFSISMRQVHVAGERAFVDYSGKRLTLTDAVTGETRAVELFVIAMGASSYTYAEASLSQTLPDFCASVTRSLEFFGGAPLVLVPDQLRSAVKSPDRYDPDLTRTLCDLSSHYGMTVLPARPRKPKDKAKVEGAVQVVQRWILARLWKESFTLNERIRELLTILNAKPFQKLDGSRASFFERFDKPALRPLPSFAFDLGQWKKARVGKDTHVSLLNHAYSVPYAHIGEVVEIRYTPSIVEVFARGERIASHARNSDDAQCATTDVAHLPQAQQAHGKWTETRMLDSAATYGTSVREVVFKILSGYPKPEFGFRASLGVLALANVYGTGALNDACAHLLITLPSTPRRKTLLTFLRRNTPANGLRTQEPRRESRSLGMHEHIRGEDYFLSLTPTEKEETETMH
jgi:transposase